MADTQKAKQQNYHFLDLLQWNRKEHFDFYLGFSEPFWGVTVEIDCTTVYQRAKAESKSFFLSYTHKILQCVNDIEEMRYRIDFQGSKLKVYDQIHLSTTIKRPNGTFGFAFIRYYPDLQEFIDNATISMEEVRKSTSLFPPGEDGTTDAVIYYSVSPWLRFTSFSHARHFEAKDSVPRFAVGKMEEKEGKKTFPLSVHVHHGLLDGSHVGQFIEKLEKLMSQ